MIISTEKRKKKKKEKKIGTTRKKEEGRGTVGQKIKRAQRPKKAQKGAA
jgi:hypothetical protein